MTQESGAGQEPAPFAVGSPQPSVYCSLNGDVTGNNFHGIWACFETGIQIGNPSQYGGKWATPSQSGLPGPGGNIFMGFGTPPPNTYGPNGTPISPATYVFPPGSWYFQNDTGNIWWFSGSTWTQKI